MQTDIDKEKLYEYMAEFKTTIDKINSNPNAYNYIGLGAIKKSRHASLILKSDQRSTSSTASSENPKVSSKSPT